MLEAYSEDITVSEGADIPLNNIALLKGNAIIPSGNTSANLMHRGVYKVDVTASATATATGLMAIQLYRDNVALPQACSGDTADDTTSMHSMKFATLVQVPEDARPCPGSMPVSIKVKNIGTGAVYDTVDVLVIKVK